MASSASERQSSEAQVVSLPAFPPKAFDRLGACQTEAESKNCLSSQVDHLIYLVNALPACNRIASFRQAWSAKKAVGLFADRPFGDTDYVHGGRAHWYIYHRGGRWEPQFNIGMFGAPVGGRRYLRIGMGFSLTLNSRDPDREARLQGLYSLFYGFRSLVRGSGRGAVCEVLREQGDGILERDGHVPDATLDTPEKMVDWVAAWAHPRGWLFLGTRLCPEREADSAKLSNWRELTREIDMTFGRFEPIWRQVMKAD